MATNITLETSMGTISLELYTNHAPKTCQNFETLVKRGYYNECPFHRIIPNFMIQGGDPTGTGRGGASIYGNKFDDFITLAPTPWLDGKHTIFGRVTSGMRIVQRMGLTKVDSNDKPIDNVSIMKARILEPEE
ncbi:Peptidyl-prolyl cis-trans isomerase-like 1 [Maublancomyces gigas]|uniref:Peptidyl-prolyl cis-trans isomerase n=1 Tax=Discina gigas TaxID=1032678 RepID=A0ABR3GMN1_9PEZI